MSYALNDEKRQEYEDTIEEVKLHARLLSPIPPPQNPAMTMGESPELVGAPDELDDGYIPSSEEEFAELMQSFGALQVSNAADVMLDPNAPEWIEV